MNTQNYQTTQIQKEIPLAFYLQQHEITKTQLTNFSQILNAAEPLQRILIHTLWVDPQYLQIRH